MLQVLQQKHEAWICVNNVVTVLTWFFFCCNLPLFMVTGHVMWPAVIVDESQVIDRKGMGKNHGGRSVPVQFFGTHDFARYIFQLRHYSTLVNLLYCSDPRGLEFVFCLIKTLIICLMHPGYRANRLFLSSEDSFLLFT